MKKKIIVVLASILVLMTSAYTGFWFFKANQIKKQLSLLSKKEGSKFSVEEISVEGFPLLQKTTIKNFKFTDPKDSINATVKNVQIESSAFSNAYSVKILDPIELEDLKRNINAAIELSADTVISLAIDESEVFQIKILGSGFKFLNKTANKAALVLEAQNSETEISISDNAGFRYKYKDSGSKILDEKNNVVFTAAASLIDIAYSADDNDVISVKSNISLKDFEYSPLLYSALREADSAQTENESDVASTKAVSNKSNFTISSEVIFTPNKQDSVDLLPAEQMAQIPDDLKSQYQAKPSPYSYKIDLQNFEFSNSLYKILINGLVNTVPENIEPLGFLVLKIENIDNFAKDILSELRKFSNKHSSAEQFANEESGVFNKSLSIVKELGAKNSLSRDNFLVFDIKNERAGMASEFKINDTAFMEIVMNFTQQNNAQNPSIKGSNVSKSPLNKNEINVKRTK
jgi:hypothetical protein